GFYLLHRAGNGQATDVARDIFVDAREVAPAAATRDMFLDEKGEAVPGKSLDTALAAGIPGEPAAWAHLAEHYGRLPLRQSLAPAIRLAREGFSTYPRLADYFGDKKAAFERTVDGKRIFLVKGEPPAVGALFKQTDLAKSLEVLARDG